MASTTSNPAIVNFDTRHFIIIMVVASEVSELDGKIASIVCLVSHYFCIDSDKTHLCQNTEVVSCL